MQDHKRLRVWHLARKLAVKVVKAFPERTGRAVPGLRSQVISAATSVAANIAEGCALATRPEFLHFLEIAMGSLNELESHLLLAWETDVLNETLHEELKADVDLVRRMLLALIRAVERHIAEDEQLRQTRRARADSEHPADAERR